MTTKAGKRRITFCNEPYYPPGYCGYSPQFPFQFGDTYGKTTSRLLTDPTVAKSGRLVLADIFAKESDDPNESADKNDWMRLRKHSWGDKKLGEKMVPGYTGYIPNKEDHFGTRYANICSQATAYFGREQRAISEKRRELIQPKPPKKPICSEARPFVSLNQGQHSVSPYFMNTNDPAKTFMSGYTGFIPRARSRYAQVYPNLTNKALVEFTHRQQHIKLKSRQPVTPNNNPNQQGFNGASSIYLHGGLQPHYTGYLPGHKFRFGVTYGTSSRTAAARMEGKQQKTC